MRTVSLVFVISLIFVAVVCAQEPAQRPGVGPREGKLVRLWGLAHGWKEAAGKWQEGGRFPGQAPLLKKSTYEPTADDRKCGFVCFVPDRNQVRPVDCPPMAGEVSRELEALAFPGEYEGLTLGIYACKDLEKLGVDVSDLRGPQGSVIRSSQIVVREVIYAPLSLRNRRDKSNRFVMHPLWLLRPELEPAVLQIGKTRLFWLTIPCPKGCPAGRYAGEVKIGVGGKVQATRHIELDMQPFALDDSLCCWMPVTGSNGFGLELYQQLAEHHMTGLSWWWGHWGLTITREGDRASFDPRLLDLLNAVTREAGMRGPWMIMLGNMFTGHLEKRIAGLYSDRREPPLFNVKMTRPPKLASKSSPSWAQGPTVGDLSDTEMDRRYVEVLQALARRAREKGYPEIILMAYDEATPYLFDWHTHRTELIHKYVPEFKTISTPQGYLKWAEKLMTHTDYMVVRGRDDPIYELTIKAGKGIIGYGRLTADKSFATTRYDMGLRFAKQQPDVIFFWSLNFGKLDERTPFNDLSERDSGFRHRFAWPPASPGEPWIETVAWEAQREGAKDYLLLLMLERELQFSTPPKASKIRKQLDEFKRQAAMNASDMDQRRAQLVRWYRQLLAE